MTQTYINTPTRFKEVAGYKIAYTEMGNGDTPIIYLNHLAANLDGCDPYIMDGLAKNFSVISLDYRGVGLSEGPVAHSVEEMAQEIIAFIHASGYRRVHLLGLSLGGFVAQEVLRQAPELIQSLILAGTGPAGDKGIARVPRITFYDMLRGILTANDPRYFLFFPNNREAKHAAKAFIARTSLRQERDKATTLSVLLKQLRAVTAWAKQAQQDFSRTTQRVWIVNGDYDRMVPTAGSYRLAQRIPSASLTIYEGAGHGAIFQEPERFVLQATTFYEANS